MADSFSVVSWPLPTGVLAVTLKAEVFLLHGVYKRLRSQSFMSLVSCVVDLFYMPQEKDSPGAYKTNYLISSKIEGDSVCRVKTNQLCDRQMI